MFRLGVKMTPRETENNGYAKYWGDKQRIKVCYGIFWSGQLSRDVIGRLSVNPWFIGYEEPNVVARFREFVAQKRRLVSKSKVPFRRSLAFLKGY